MEKIKNFYEKNIKEKVVSLLKQGLTPHELALSFAFGFAGGLFPILGTTSLVCALFIYIFNLNIAATQLINLLITPLDFAMVIPYMNFGNKIFMTESTKSIELSDLMKEGAFSIFFWGFLRATVAWMISVPVIVGIIYLVLKPILSRVLQKNIKF